MTVEIALFLWVFCLISGSVHIVAKRNKAREVRTIWDLEKEA